MRALLPLIALMLSACYPNIKPYSGADYLAGYAPPDPVAAAPALATAQPAAVEPSLRLPARFGIARIAGHDLVPIPEVEARMWRAWAAQNRAYGDFVLVYPMLAQATAAAVGGDLPNIGGPDYPVNELVALIRLGAARQHLDAVLIYEVAAQGREAETLLAAADFTVLGGAILPTRSIDATGMATALLIDVRTGYLYGTARAADADLSEFATTWGANEQVKALQISATRAVVGNLVGEVGRMVTRLADALRRS